MKKNIPQLLSEILRITTEMRDEARSGSWDRVQELERERRALIGSCFPLVDTPADLEQTRNQIAEIIDINTEVMAAASGAREEQARGLSKLRQGREATRAYREVGT